MFPALFDRPIWFNLVPGVVVVSVVIANGVLAVTGIAVITAITPFLTSSNRIEMKKSI